MRLSALLDADDPQDASVAHSSQMRAPSASSFISADPEIRGLTADSRHVDKGFLFAAIKGYGLDGRDFIPQAVEKGAVAILSDLDAVIPEEVIAVRDVAPRACLARCASRFYDKAPENLYGVTGTNGKTSTAYFAAQLFEALGQRSASVGTLGALSADNAIEISIGHTTPDPVTLHAALSSLAEAGVRSAILEASSHGLSQDRLAGVLFDGAAFSNITQDHLDYHTDFSAYFNAKARLFRDCVKEGGFAVINMDGPGAEDMARLARERGLRVIETGANGADLTLKALEATPRGLRICLTYLDTTHDLHLPVIGAFQAQNALLAAGLALGAGFPIDAIIEKLTTLSAPPGRMQCAASSTGLVGKHISGQDNTDQNGFAAYVDYAHTPDAITAALAAIRPHATSKVIAVVGAGGDRDARKRVPMGAAAVAGADHVIITDDNPRSEDPAIIRAEVLKGASSAPSAAQTKIEEIGDRRAAIKAGIRALKKGDVLLVLGKGHETGQIIGDRVLPFDDVKEVEAAFEVGKGVS
ncbi:MAG: UDP-N-acetylmuramoyl-L-alanyl-D-glutamate--2,6-diaminopimelate ligase [Pseudomonadota bacterium]